MKVVMFADLHLERQFAWADAAAASRRRQGLRSTLTNIVNLAVAEDADAILCGGDLYEDDFFSPDLMNFVAATMDCGIPALFSPGNHDHLSRTSLYHRASLPGSAHVFTAPTLQPFELAPGLRVWGAAHVSSTGTPGFFDQGFAGVADGWGTAAGSDVNLALFHGSERAGFGFEGEDKHPHAPFDATQVAQAGMDYAFVGHHHRATASEFHCYPGNPDPLEFGEQGQRGAVVAEIATDGQVSVQHRRVAATEAHSLTIDIGECDNGSDVLDMVGAQLAPLHGFVRVDLTGELHPDVEVDLAMIHALGRHLDGFQARISQVRRSYDLADIASEDGSVRAHFVRLIDADAEMSDEDKRLVVELGLRAFDNRRDLEVV